MHNKHRIITARLISQEIVGRLLNDLLLPPPRVRIESRISFIHIFVELQKGSLVVAPVAVVGRAENSADAVIVLQLVALVHQLMGSRYHLQPVRVVELLSDILNYQRFTAPNKNPAPLGLSLNPTAASSGSLHSKSDPAPFSGTSCTLGRSLISCNVLMEGERPPCKQNISFCTTAVMGI